MSETIAAIEQQDGLYRIVGRDGIIVYVGEGRLRVRLASHAAKLATSSTRAQVFQKAAPLRLSVVTGPWFRHHRLELETDLIAACFLARPAAAGRPVHRMRRRRPWGRRCPNRASHSGSSAFTTRA